MQLQVIYSKIIELRGKQVILDYELAAMYGVETKSLKRAVNRNMSRFPEDFMFQLTKEEFQNLRCQFGTSNPGGTRYMPYAFTESGIAMLSSVLNSDVAIQMNIYIIRAFVLLRKYTLNYKDLADKLLEHDKQFDDVHFVLNHLVNKDTIETTQRQRKKIGFKPQE